MKEKKLKLITFYLPFFLILTISLFTMYHARIINPIYKNHLLKQGLFFFIGILLLIFKNKIKTKWLFDYSPWFYWINVFLLFLVLFVGSTTNGAKAWFNLGFFSYQPSESMKLTLCLYLSHITEKQTLKNKKEKSLYFLKILILTLIPSILVFLEPDTGAIIFYFLISLAIIFSTSISKKWIILLFLLFISFIGIFFYVYYNMQEVLVRLIGTSFFYRVERLLNFQKGLQIDNALTAIGSAPFFLFNLNNSRIYIPEAPTDFAFTLAANTLGIFGLLILLMSYLLVNIFFLNLWKIKRKTKEKYFISGFLLMFFFQEFYNILMNVGLLPIMGIPLPFFSYGGSNTIVYFLFLMLILKKNYYD